MSIMENVFSVLGILIIIGGFIYGIYDTYGKPKGADSASAETAPQSKQS